MIVVPVQAPLSSANRIAAGLWHGPQGFVPHALALWARRTPWSSCRFRFL